MTPTSARRFFSNAGNDLIGALPGRRAQIYTDKAISKAIRRSVVFATRD
jgi:hypothetical protein